MSLRELSRKFVRMQKWVTHSRVRENLIATAVRSLTYAVFLVLPDLSETQEM